VQGGMPKRPGPAPPKRSAPVKVTFFGSPWDEWMMGGTKVERMRPDLTRRVPEMEVGMHLIEVDGVQVKDKAAARKAIDEAPPPPVTLTFK